MTSGQEERNISRWYNSPLWVTIIGSTFLIIGQVVSTLVPIAFGPNDVSDFYISVSPIYYDLGIKSNPIAVAIKGLEGPNPQDRQFHIFLPDGCNFLFINGSIKICNTHEYLKRYNHDVFLKAIDKYKGIDVDIEIPEGRPSFKTNISINISYNTTPGNYPIMIQGVGGDGRIRTCTLYLKVSNNLSGESWITYFRDYKPIVYERISSAKPP